MNLQQQYLTFQLRQGLYALPLESVVEVVRLPALAQLPGAPAWLTGVLNLRGVAVPVMDVRLRLGLPAAALTLATPLIIVSAVGRPVGLIVDALQQVTCLPAQALAAPDQLSGPQHALAAHAIDQQQLISVVDLLRLTAGVEELVLEDVLLQRFGGDS